MTNPGDPDHTEYRDWDYATMGSALPGSAHLVSYDRTPPRRVKKKPIGFNAVFPPKKPPVKRPAPRKKR